MELYGGIVLIILSLVVYLALAAVICDEEKFEIKALIASLLLLGMFILGVSMVVEYKQKSWAVDIGIADWREWQKRGDVGEIDFKPIVAKIINEKKLKKINKEKKKIEKNLKSIEKKMKK